LNAFSENGLTKERNLYLEYARFFKTEDGKKFVKTFGKTVPGAYHHYKGRNGSLAARLLRGEADIDFCDPADLPTAYVLDHPIDRIEPFAHSGIQFEDVSYDEIQIATLIFETSMRWCIDATGLAAKGLRCNVVISTMRWDLAEGLKIDKTLERRFIRANQSSNGSVELSGRLFGPVLEWLRRADKRSERGERITVLFYHLRPDLISENTLAALGRISNKTRQAKDKLVNCLRDTCAGIRARTMRATITRNRCRSSQLANYRSRSYAKNSNWLWMQH